MKNVDLAGGSRGDDDMTPYYQDEAVTLYLGDCREVIPRLQPVSIVVTDPPYNAGKKYGESTNDRREWPEWCAWFDEVLSACLHQSADGVLSFLSQTAYRQYVRLGQHEMAWSAVWIKPLSMAVCAAPFMPHWEPIAYWGDKRRKHGDGEGWGSDVIVANVEFGKERWNHPTPKPLTAMLALVSKMEGTILEPFAGSGTTLAAAKYLGKRAVGIEVEEQYCEIIARRLECTAIGVRPSVNQGALELFEQPA